MQITSKIYKIPNSKDFSVEYIETQLKKIYMIIPLRWAIVEIKNDFIFINTSYTESTL